MLTHGGGFAFQLCLDTGVHHLAAFTLHRATTLGQHLHQSAGTTAEVLHSHQFVVDGAVTACRQICLVRHHRSIQRRQSGTQFVLCCVTCRLLLGECLQACLQATNLATSNMQSQGAQLGDECTVSTCGIGLTFEWLQLTANLAQQVLCSHEVCFGTLQTTFGLLFSFAVLQHTGCFFDDGTAIFWSRVQHGVDLSLAHDHVLLTTNTRIGQQFLHVEQAAVHAVDGVFTLTRTEQGSGDGDFGEFNGQQPRGVVDGE